MRDNTVKRTLSLLTTTSAIALGLAMTPVAIDFDLHKPVLKHALAKGGGEGGGSGGGEGVLKYRFVEVEVDGDWRHGQAERDCAGSGT